MDIHKIYALVGRRFRQKRMIQFCEAFRPKRETHILDLGGTVRNWLMSPVLPDVSLLNLNYDTRDLQDGHKAVRGDALCCPFCDGQFDIAFCNSLIEHLGNWQNQSRLAMEIRREARGYFVQTPNKWFPLEPHYLTPMVQFVPRKIKPGVIRWLTVWGWITKPTKGECVALSDEVRLLDARDMRTLFPDATIIRERFLGITKSIIALKVPDRGEASRSQTPS